MTKPLFTIHTGDGPILATAIHDGHDLREDLHELMALSDAERLREEDPFTDELSAVVDQRIVVHRSRFEVDLNRPREGAVYQTPEQAWGLNVWKQPLPEEAVSRALEEYDEFYQAVESLYQQLAATHGRFVVLDVHTYNHRRNGPDGPPANPEGNPEVNIGTGSIDRGRWGGLVDRFMDDMRTSEVNGRPLDVRENVKFNGGNFAWWAHGRFPESACVIAIEFKKIFMDEWTGEPDMDRIRTLRDALAGTIPGLLEELAKA